jgi:hypothetical protein
MAHTQDDIIEDIPWLRLELLAQVGDLQDVMRSEDIPFGRVENEMLSAALQLRPDERQVAGLPRLVVRLDTMVTRHDDAEARRICQVQAHQVSQFSVSGSPSAASTRSNCLHAPKRRALPRARGADDGTTDSPFLREIDPRVRPQIESFARFAVPHLRQSTVRRLAMYDLIAEYKESLAAEAQQPDVHAFFKNNYITMQDLKNAATSHDSVQDALVQGLASIGRHKFNYGSLSLQRCLELKPDCPCIKWCMEFCTRNADAPPGNHKLTRPQLEAHWKAAPEYVPETNQIRTLFSQGVLNMKKIVSFMDSVRRRPPGCGFESGSKKRRRGGNPAGAATTRC